MREEFQGCLDSRCAKLEFLQKVNHLFDMDLHRSLSQQIDDLLSLPNSHSIATMTDIKGNSFLHMACQLGGRIELVKQLIERHGCKVDSTNIYGETPLHFACAGGHSDVVDMLISRYSADLKVKDKDGNEPLHTAAQNGHTELIDTTLISKYGCNLNSRGQNGQTLLHLSVANGHNELAEKLLESFNVSIAPKDHDGNSPLHLASLNCHEENLETLLHRHHAPVFLKNKDGNTAQDVSKDKDCLNIFKQYLDNPMNAAVQSTMKELHTLSLGKYSSQPITRIFVLGNVKSGKSSLIEAFKHRGLLESHIRIDETTVAPNTSGIVPSHYDSRMVGRIIYYDFAGNTEYYSSHSAIIEMVFQSQGNNLFCIVLNLIKDVKELTKELGYWLSFVSYVHKQNSDSQSKLKTLVICSHVDKLHRKEVDEKAKVLKELSSEFMQLNNTIKVTHIFYVDCCKPKDVRQLKEVIQEETKDAAPYRLSYEAALLHGVLERDFNNVVTCKLKDVMAHIEMVYSRLPCMRSDSNKLHFLSRELQNAGLLLIVGRNEDQLEDHLLITDITSLTNKVHKKLFSKEAREKLKSLPAKMGILPENCLYDIFELPKYVTKECLIQLQYCHEFNRVEVKYDDHAIVPNLSSSDRLLYFPDLCKLESASTAAADTPNPDSSRNDINIGWYAKCIGKFDYFPPRFLHTILLRLAYSFALPIAKSNVEEVHLSIREDNRRCTMWKNGIRWMMEEGVECICEVVDDYNGIVVVTRASKSYDNLITGAILRRIIEKVLLTKAQYCDTISLRYFLLNSADPCAYQNEDELYDINDVENVLRQRDTKKKVVSVGGNKFLDSSIPMMLSHCTYWGKHRNV